MREWNYHGIFLLFVFGLYLFRCVVTQELLTYFFSGRSLSLYRVIPLMGESSSTIADVLQLLFVTVFVKDGGCVRAF